MTRIRWPCFPTSAVAAGLRHFFKSYVVSSERLGDEGFRKTKHRTFRSLPSHEWLPSVVDLQMKEDGQGSSHTSPSKLRPNALPQRTSGVSAENLSEMYVPKNEPVIHLNLSWFQKPATRLLRRYG